MITRDVEWLPFLAPAGLQTPFEDLRGWEAPGLLPRFLLGMDVAKDDQNSSSAVFFDASIEEANKTFNESLWSGRLETETYIFHQPQVKIPLLIVYSVVFVLAFFGNLLVVLVMTLHRRMRSHTNFFLTNLAVADLCVAVFCIYQNFAMYVIQDWYLGQFLCQMYHFVTSLSCTASVIILVVVSGERYLAIVEPLRAKSILTRKNMMITMGLVWVFSALYSCPRLFFFEVAEYPVEGGTEAMCILRRDQFDTKTWDVVSLLLLFLLPLLLLTVLYIKIAQVLCASSKLLAQASNCDAGRFVRTGTRSSISGTGKGCPCSTRQECLTTMTSMHTNRRGTLPSNTRGHVSPTTPIEEGCGYNPTVLNTSQESYLQKKNTGKSFLKYFAFVKKWNHPKLSKCACSGTEMECKVCSKRENNENTNRTRCGGSESCIHKILIQENSLTYSSLTEVNPVQRPSDPNDYMNTQQYLPSYFDSNFKTLTVTPIPSNNSTHSLHVLRHHETPPENMAVHNSLLNIHSAHNHCSYSSSEYPVIRCRYEGSLDRCPLHEHPPCLRDSCGRRGGHRQDCHSYRSSSCTLPLRPDPLRRAVVMRPSPVVLKARRKVVHMLVLVVISFAVFSLPFHTRKMMQYFLPSYDHTSEFSIVLTPITCLVMFAHSAVNPILYTCLSRKFRTSLKDLVTCKMTRRSSNGNNSLKPNSRPLLARLKPDGKVSLQLH